MNNIIFTMTADDQKFFERRPQVLCKMCGKCCRMSTTSKTYEEIKSLADAGDKGALDFLEIFEPYESVEAAKNADSATVNNIIKMLSSDGNYDESKMTFYHCRFIGDDNLCSKYLDRKELCKHFPSSPWAVVPPGCGFEGWLFTQREEIKRKVRKEKEELLELKLLKSRTTNKESLEKIELVEQKINRNIELYSQHGSKDW